MTNNERSENSERFVLEPVSFDELRSSLIQHFGLGDVSDEDVRHLLLTLRVRAAPDDKVDLPLNFAVESALGIRHRLGQVVINVERSLIAALILALDISVTKGASAILASAIGYDFRAVSGLSRTNGELCNYISLQGVRRNGFPISASDLTAITSGAPCRQSELECKLRVDGVCTIRSEDASRNINRMAGKGMLDLNEGSDVRSIA